VLLLRVTGKRTLAKMNAFDLVVTVSFGSTLATLLLSRDVSLAEGLLAFALLCLLQYAVAFTSVRSPRFRELVKSEPTALVLDGRLLADRLRRERVSRDEVLAAVRAQGIASLSQVAAVVLETDGSFSVVRQADGGADTLANVRGPEPPEH
jgi:uncharacterized membrane protein YcaP (DUF421 family)